jgi:hypothetical protein
MLFRKVVHCEEDLGGHVCISDELNKQKLYCCVHNLERRICLPSPSRQRR